MSDKRCCEHCEHLERYFGRVNRCECYDSYFWGCQVPPSGCCECYELRDSGETVRIKEGE